MYHKLIVVIVGLGSILLLVLLTYLLFSIPTPRTKTSSDTSSTISESLMKNTLKAVNATEPNRAEVIARWYMPLIPLSLGEVSLQASVADTDGKREQGLSGTPYIPTGVVKLFVFDTPGMWSFWMKDMNYPIDIIWLDETKTVIHTESNLTPETYPQSFAPSTDARYVIETTAGFSEMNRIAPGTKATW